MAKSPEKVPSKTSALELSEPDELAEEITKRISNLVPQGSRSQIVAQMVSLVKEERFSGPIAHPKHLREYEEICPGAADRIISMAERNLSHGQSMQDKALQADIDDGKAARLYGFLALMALIVAAGVAAYNGSEIVAGLFLGTGVLGVVGQIIQGAKNKSED